MSIFGWLRGTGRRRFQQSDAVAAREAAEHWMARALAAEGALEVAVRERGEFEAALDFASQEYAQLDARQKELRAQLAVLSTNAANREAQDVPAPIDAHPDVYGEKTVETNVTTIRARFGTAVAPVIPIGGDAA